MNHSDDDRETGQGSIFGDLIYAYTRAQAIEDGVLIEVAQDVAMEYGFRIPVAITAAAWHACIPVPQHLRMDPFQSETGRMADLLRVLRFVIRHNTTPGQETIRFKLALQQPKGGHQSLWLKAICGPGDSGEPVLTIMLPNED